jgi:hypothetical protein
MNNGKFDGGLTDKEKSFETSIKDYFNFSINSSALMGEFEIQTINRQSDDRFDPGIYAYTRWSELKTNCCD